MTHLHVNVSFIKVAAVVDRNRELGLPVIVWINEILGGFEIAGIDLSKLVTDLIWMGERHPEDRAYLRYHQDGRVGGITITF